MESAPAPSFRGAPAALVLRSSCRRSCDVPKDREGWHWAGERVQCRETASSLALPLCARRYTEGARNGKSGCGDRNTASPALKRSILGKLDGGKAEEGGGGGGDGLAVSRGDGQRRAEESLSPQSHLRLKSLGESELQTSPASNALLCLSKNTLLNHTPSALPPPVSYAGFLLIAIQCHAPNR